MMTREEEDLVKRLSASPKCMHDPEYVKDHDAEYWVCTQCGMFARKSIWGIL